MRETLTDILDGPDWWERGNCAFGVKQTVAGVRVFDDRGQPLMSWVEYVAAMDKVFFAQRDERRRSGKESRGLALAVKECLSCPVRRRCLDWALREEASVDNGVYGGTTQWERRTMMREDFLPALTRQEKVEVLDRLVHAKAMGVDNPDEGWPELSVNIDWLPLLLRQAAASDIEPRPEGYEVEPKKCVQCGEVKPRNQFRLSNTALDGRRPECRDCSRARARKEEVPVG